MFKKYMQLLFLPFLVAGLFFVPVYPAGTVLQLFRVDINGKRKILFGERHLGYNDTFNQRALAVNQAIPLHNLFDDFEKRKNEVSLYIEANPTYCQLKKNYLTQNKQEEIQKDAYASFFNHFYNSYIDKATEVMGVSQIQNFDERALLDVLFGYLAGKFDDFYTTWKNSGFNQAVYNSERADFMNNPHYQMVKRYYHKVNEYIQSDVNSIIESCGNRFEISRTYPQVCQANIVGNTNWFTAFKNLGTKARAVNKDFFEYLFDIALRSKDNFYPLLKILSDTQFPIEYVFDIFNFNRPMVDINLTQWLYNDQHTFALAHAGISHAREVFEMLKNLPGVSYSNVLDLQDERLLNDNDLCYQAMRHFIFD